MNFIKIKKFYSTKDIVKRMRRQTIDWKKIFSKEISTKRLYSKYKELSISTISKWKSQLKQIPNQRRYEKKMKRFSASYVIREWKFKTTPISLHTYRMTRNWNFYTIKCWKGYGSPRTLSHCWWECSMVQPL